MLYLTTRSRTDSYTSNRALRESAAPEGGAFLPFRFPVLSQEEIAELSNLSFSEAAAQMLNRFFPVKLTAWDVEFSAGRNLISLFRFGRKICCVRAWNSVHKAMEQLTGRLYALLCSEIYVGQTPSGWAKIAIWISLLVGFTAELMKNDIASFDVALNDQDFDMVVAAWYCRSMGLPIGNILCGCGANSALWELFHKGEANAKQLRNYPGVEMLIYSALGLEENLRYLQTSGIYKLDRFQLPKVNAGMFASVVGYNRMTSLIQSVLRTDRILIDPAMAVSYGALQDYRSKTGESNMTLILSTQDPANRKKEIVQAAGIPEGDFEKYTK